VADEAEFELMDMSDEALQHAAQVLADLRVRAGRRTRYHTRRRSVLGLLKDAARVHEGEQRQPFDFVYCAGLFDYLTDPVCRQLLAVAYGWLAPGGLLVTTNVDTYRPFRHMLEFLLEWHLNYRDRRQFAALVPEQVPPGGWSITSEATGTNLFLEIRKPETS
jgi:extracellular factor (EF) 3-hydroxypalmitic acid methyl ester biosynthesis protein